MCSMLVCGKTRVLKTYIGLLRPQEGLGVGEAKPHEAEPHD